MQSIWDLDEVETEEEKKAGYYFPSTPTGKRMLEESEKSRSLTYQEFKIEIAEFVEKLKYAKRNI